MSDMSKPAIAFFDVMKLPEGYQEEYSFTSHKEADSFRTALYKIKRKMNDNSVSISIFDKTITLMKMSNVIERKRISPTGEVISISNEKEESVYKLQVEEILKDAEDFPEHQRNEYIRDALSQLNFTPRRRK